MLFGLVFARGGAGGGDAVVVVVVLLLFLFVIDTFATLNDAPCGFICRFILLAKRATGPFLVVIIKFGRRATADHLRYSRVKVAIVLLLRGTSCQCSAAITHKSNDIVCSGASRAVVIRDGQLVDQAAHVLASRHAVRRRWNKGFCIAAESRLASRAPPKLLSPVLQISVHTHPFIPFTSQSRAPPPRGRSSRHSPSAT